MSEQSKQLVVLDYGVPIRRASRVNWRRLRRWGYWVTLLLLALWGGMEGYRWARVVAAERDGVAEAKAELARGQATIYAYGYQSWPFDRYDPSTGLPYKTVGGCVVDDRMLARTRGHNETIHTALRNGTIPLNSRRQWNAQISDLKGYFTSLSGGAVVLRLNGAAARLADGRFAIAMVPATGDWKRAGEVGMLQLTDPSWTGWVRPFQSFGAQPEVHVVWGPSGSDLAFLYFPGAKGTHEVSYGLLDLRTGEWIRFE